METGHNGVVGGLLGANHAEGELELVLGLVPILHRQITDEVVSDLVNGQGIVKEFVAQVKNYSSHKNKTRHGHGDFENRFLQDCRNKI